MAMKRQMLKPFRELINYCSRGNDYFRFCDLPPGIQQRVMALLSRHDLLNLMWALKRTKSAIRKNIVNHVTSVFEYSSSKALITIVDIDCEKEKSSLYNVFIKNQNTHSKTITHLGLRRLTLKQMSRIPLQYLVSTQSGLASVEIGNDGSLALFKLTIRCPLVINCKNPNSFKVTFTKCDASAPVTVLESIDSTPSTEEDPYSLSISLCTPSFMGNFNMSGIHRMDVYQHHGSRITEVKDQK